MGGACAQRHGISAARKLLWLTHSSGVRNRVHATTTVASNDPRASFTTRLGHGRGAPQDLTYWHCLDDEQWRKSERTRVEATTTEGRPMPSDGALGDATSLTAPLQDQTERAPGDMGARPQHSRHSFHGRQRPIANRPRLHGMQWNTMANEHANQHGQSPPTQPGHSAPGKQRAANECSRDETVAHVTTGLAFIYNP